MVNLVASSMVVKWLGRPHRTGFDAQIMHSFLDLFRLKKVLDVTWILVQEEGPVTESALYVRIR